MTTPIIYLASPYTHEDPAVMEERFCAVSRVAARLIRRGNVVFSPISHSHSIAQYGLPKDWMFWKRFDTAFIERCTEMRILRLPGWKESKGVAEEYDIAMKRGLFVSFMDDEETI